MNPDNEFIRFAEQTPIRFDFEPPKPELIQDMQRHDSLAIIEASELIEVQNAYYQADYPGTYPQVFARQALAHRLPLLSSLLPPGTTIRIFDAFRSIRTQEYLFETFKSEVRAEHPDWEDDDIERRALEFVSHPHDTRRFTVPLHNSGGAIDLTLLYQDSGQAWDFGTDIDAITDLSYTDYFEREFVPQLGFDEQRWQLVRINRRRLYHAMCQLGFINFPNEWWHYDLGDCLWAKVFAREPLFDSMESLVIEYMTQSEDSHP